MTHTTCPSSGGGADRLTPEAAETTLGPLDHSPAALHPLPVPPKRTSQPGFTEKGESRQGRVRL